MQPKFNPLQGGYDAELLCPNCGGNYFHHGLVEIFERTEDGDYGIHAAVDNGKATIDTCLAGNPSARRHGLTVHFWCEQCSSESVLIIAQHKGNTHTAFKPKKKT